MLLQGNQRGTFHPRIPVIHLLVVVLRNVQAPAEITRILIIVTLWFNATLHYSLACLVHVIYKNTLISGVPSNTRHFHTQKEIQYKIHNVSELMALGYITFLRLYFREFFLHLRVILRRCDCCKHCRTEWMLILADTLSSQSLHRCLGKQKRYSFGPMKWNHLRVCACVCVRVRDSENVPRLICTVVTTVQKASVCVRVCMCDTHSVSRLCKPSKHLAPMLWIWLLWRCLEKGHKYFSTNQKLLKNVSTLQSSPPCSKSMEQIISLVSWETQSREGFT